MHPDLLRALAKTRHEELLAKRQNPGHPRVRRDAVHRGSFVPVCAWAHSSSGQVRA